MSNTTNKHSLEIKRVIDKNITIDSKETSKANTLPFFINNLKKRNLVDITKYLNIYNKLFYLILITKAGP
jgi:hypothetical protein